MKNKLEMLHARVQFKAMWEHRFDHDFVTHVCPYWENPYKDAVAIDPNVWFELYTTLLKACGRFDFERAFRYAPDGDKEVDYYIYGNHFGIRYSNEGSDYTSAATYNLDIWSPQ